MIGIWHTRYFFNIFILPSHHKSVLCTKVWPFSKAGLSSLERLALENGHTLVQRTDIFSWKFSVKVFLMLNNPFLVPSRCKLNHISLCFIQINTKSRSKLLVLFRESTVFLKSSPVFSGPPYKFQHNIKISIKTICFLRLWCHK